VFWKGILDLVFNANHKRVRLPHRFTAATWLQAVPGGVFAHLKQEEQLQSFLLL
jgi:hypothetical protein